MLLVKLSSYQVKNITEKTEKVLSFLPAKLLSKAME